MVALSLRCMVMGATEIVAVEVDSEDTVLDLKKAIQVEAPALISCDFAFIRLFLARRSPEAIACESQQQQQQQQQHWQRLEPDERRQSQRSPRRYCKEMKDARRLKSFAVLRSASAQKSPQVIIQRPRRSDMRTMREKESVRKVHACLLSLVALGLLLPFAFVRGWREVLKQHDCAADQDQAGCDVWPVVAAYLGLGAGAGAVFLVLFDRKARAAVAEAYSTPPLEGDEA